MRVIIFWAHRPISFEHVSFRYLFLKAHLTTYHSITCVQLRKVIERGTSTLSGFYVVTLPYSGGGFTIGFKTKETSQSRNPIGREQDFGSREPTPWSGSKNLAPIDLWQIACGDFFIAH